MLAKVDNFFREDRRLPLDEIHALILKLSRSEAITENLAFSKPKVVCFLHDNARPHTARLTVEFLEGFG